MNIFASFQCPIKSAKFLDNSRVVKMILESAQLLSAAIHLNGGNTEGLYKLTHKGHPCTIWATKSSGNWHWLYAHYLALCDEYTRRYGKVHKSSLLQDKLAAASTCIPKGPRTEFQNSARNNSLNLDYSHLTVHEAYQTYLIERFNTDKTPAVSFI